MRPSGHCGQLTTSTSINTHRALPTPPNLSSILVRATRLRPVNGYDARTSPEALRASIRDNVLRFAHRYLDVLHNREVHIIRRWSAEMLDPAKGNWERLHAVSEFVVCLSPGQKQIRIAERRAGTTEQRILVLNDRYAACLRRLATGQHILIGSYRSPRWTGMYPDFRAVSICSGAPEDALLAVFSPLVAIGVPVTVALEGSQGFSSRCLVRRDGLVEVTCSTSRQQPHFFAWPDSSWRILLDPRRQYAVVRCTSTSGYPTGRDKLRSEVTYSDSPVTVPKRYRLETTSATVENGRERIFQREQVDCVILDWRVCTHPAEAFYLPYYGIEESAIEQTSSGRAIALAAGSVTALLIALLAIVALRRIGNRPSPATGRSGRTTRATAEGVPAGDHSSVPRPPATSRGPSSQRLDKEEEEENGSSPTEC